MNIVLGIWRDLTLAARSLAKARAFTFVCVVSLGIGMVPVIAVPYGFRMFTAAPAGLKTDSLVEVVTAPVDGRPATHQWSYPDFVAFRDATPGVSLFGWANGESEVDLGAALGGPTNARTMFVSSGYFAGLDIPLAQGAGLRESTDPLVVISDQFWRRRLNADPEVIGKVVLLNAVPHTIAGVGPADFGGHLVYHNAELFLPLERHPLVVADTAVRFDRAKEWVRIHGRLAPGVAIEQVSASVGALAAELSKTQAATNEFKQGVVAPYHGMGSLDASALTIIRAVLQSLSTLPLLIVCLNIASMVQVRGAIRERELSIRQAIGATRRRLMQQLLAESVVLAALGATLASFVLFYLLPVAQWIGDEPLPPTMLNALQVDATMVATCVGLCFATSLVFGWLPAARFSRPTIITVLKDETGGGGGLRVSRVQRVATALQMAVATPLIVLSGMTLDRVRATATDDLGFDAEVLYAAPLNLQAIGEQAWVRAQGVRDGLARTPGVAGVTVVDGLPLDFRYRITRVGTQPAEGTAPKVVVAHVTRVGDGYLDTLGIPLVRGRMFGAEDVAGAESVTILSKPLATQLFPDVDPLGQRLTFAVGEKSERTLTVVGVSADFPTSQMSTNRSQLLLPLAQYPDVLRDSVGVNDDLGGSAALQLVVRSAPGESAAKMTAALEQALRELDPEFESASIVTGASLRQKSVRDFMVQTSVSGVAGGILLLLAALGIYGVVGLMVATRIREIAVRIALGASRRRVVGMVLFDVMKLVAPGVVVGLLLAVAFVKLNGEDFGISLSALEPLAYVVGAVIAVLMALLASFAPARRAASVHPMVAMRSE